MKTKFSNHEAVRLQFMTQSVNSLLSGENCLKQRKSTYDKRFIRYHKCFLLKLRYGAHANSCSVFLHFKEMLLYLGAEVMIDGEMELLYLKGLVLGSADANVGVLAQKTALSSCKTYYSNAERLCYL